MKAGIYCRFPEWGYEHLTVCDSKGEYARDEDGDGFHEIHVITMEGVWSLLWSWLRPHRGISQENLPLYLAFFEFTHNLGKRGKALVESLIAVLVKPSTRNEPNSQLTVALPPVGSQSSRIIR